MQRHSVGEVRLIRALNPAVAQEISRIRACQPSAVADACYAHRPNEFAAKVVSFGGAVLGIVERADVAVE